MNLKKVISACTASMLGLSYLCSAFTVAAAEKKENLLVLGDASSKGYQNSQTITDIIEKNLDVNYHNLSADASTTEDLLNSVKENVQVIAEIKNSDSVVISAGTYDYLEEIMSVVGEYTEYGDSVEDVRKKMIDDLANSSQKIMAASSKTTQAIKNITDTVKEIKDINPNTDVYIVSLYNPFKYDINKYGATNDPMIDAVSNSVNTTLDTFNAAIYEIDDVKNIMNTNSAFNKIARKYANITEDATGLGIKEQFDLAAKVLAEITGETPASALSKVLSMIPAYMLPLLPDNFNVKPMTFDLGEATYDIATAKNNEVTLDINLIDNFGISAFQGDLKIGEGTEGFVCTDVIEDAYKGDWKLGNKNSTIQFVSDDGHNIAATDEVLGQLFITIPENIKPGEYEVSISNANISVLTSKGQKNYAETENGIIKTLAGKIIVIDSTSEVTTAASTPVSTAASAPVSTAASAPVSTAASAPVSTAASAPVSTAASAPVSTAASAPVSTAASAPVTTAGSAPVTTAGSAPVTTAGSAPVTTAGSAPVTTNPELPPVTGPVKSLNVPTGSEAQDMVSQVPYAQFYYSYDTNEFNLDGLKVEAQSYDENGEAIADQEIDITKFIQLKDKTSTPKSTFDLANKKLIYAIPLEIKPDKVENGKEYIYVETSDDKSEYFDITDLKKAFDGVTFKAYIGMRGDIDLNFITDTRDGSAVIKEYNSVSTGDDSTISKYTDTYIKKSELKLDDAEVKTLVQFTYFLGDASVNSNSDHKNAKYGIDTRDETFIIKFYNDYNMSLLTGNEVNESELWSNIEGK